MLATISTTLWDTQGHVTLDVTPESFIGGNRGRRVTRVATLDGGAVLNNFGFTHADRTLTLVWEYPTQAEHEAVARIVELYSTVTVSIAEGVFLAAIESYNPKEKESSLVLLITEKLSA